MQKIDKRLDDLERAINPDDGKLVIKVRYVETDPITGEERDAYTHELIPPPAPGVQVIHVKYDDESTGLEPDDII